MIRNIALAVFAVLLTAMLFGCGSNNGGPTGPNGDPDAATITFRSGIDNIDAVPVSVFLDNEELGTTPCSTDTCKVGGKYNLRWEVLGINFDCGSFTVKEPGSRDIVFYPGEYGFYMATGQVRDLDGQALEGVKIEAMNDSFPTASTLTQANGAFIMYILKDFTTSLRFSAEGYITTVIPIAEIPETGMDIRLAKILPTILTLQITPTSAEAEVWVDGDSLGSADANGYFESTIEPGDHELKLIGWGCKEKTVSISIEPGETKSQNISLEVWDLTGTWKCESDDSEVEVTMKNNNEIWGLNPVGRFYVKGNKLTYIDPFGSEAHAEGFILENGKRIEFTLHTQYGSDSHVYKKIS